MGKVFHLIILAASFVALGICVPAQDLGTSNKLFGKKKHSSHKIAKPSAKQRKPAPPAAKRTKKITQRDSRTASIPVRIAPRNDQRPVISTSTPVRIAPRAADTTKKVQTPKIASAEDRSREETFDRLMADGNAARESRQYSLAENAYRRAREIKAGDPRAEIALGRIFVDTFRWEDAETEYRAAIKLDPQNVDAYNALSFVLAQPVSSLELFGRYTSAEQMARKSIEIRASNAAAYDRLGVALERQGLIGSESENAYRRAISIDPAYAPAYAHLGRIMFRRGRSVEAANAYSQALSRSNDVASLVAVADSMQSEQRFAESIPVLNRALGMDPRSPCALFLAGRALTVVGRFADAEMLLTRGTEIASWSFAGFDLLGALFLQQGKYETCENWLMRATNVAGVFEKRDLAGRFEILGDGYSKAGKFAAAERVYRKALSLDKTREAITAKINILRR